MGGTDSKMQCIDSKKTWFLLPTCTILYQSKFKALSWLWWPGMPLQEPLVARNPPSSAVGLTWSHLLDQAVPWQLDIGRTKSTSLGNFNPKDPECELHTSSLIRRAELLCWQGVPTCSLCEVNVPDDYNIWLYHVVSDGINMFLLCRIQLGAWFSGRDSLFWFIEFRLLPSVCWSNSLVTKKISCEEAKNFAWPDI